MSISRRQFLKGVPISLPVITHTAKENTKTVMLSPVKQAIQAHGKGQFGTSIPLQTAKLVHQGDHVPRRGVVSWLKNMTAHGILWKFDESAKLTGKPMALPKNINPATLAETIGHFDEKINQSNKVIRPFIKLIRKLPF
ncbi:MAG: hypothetical protein ACKO37_09725 [Vampirovibrionales bacterium]